MKNRRLKYLALSVLLLMIAATVIIGTPLYRLYYQPMNLESSTTTIVRLDKSMSATAFAHVLKTQHLIDSERLFLSLVRTEGLANRLKAGVYQVKLHETCLQFLKRVAAGDVIVETFQIIEGTTRKQVSEKLAQTAYLNYQDSDWSVVTNQHANAEGLLLADTYQYDAGSQSTALLIRAHTNLLKYLDYCWESRIAGLPYKTPYELLIAASILEKETAIPAEKRVISGVIMNRLNRHMPLQMDPTVIYGLGNAYTGKLTHENMQIDSPYNSYRYRGLPPTPIAMVGKDAIDAAAHPQVSNFLYFVARGDGTHEFSETYEQQKQAIAHFLKKSTN